MSSRWRESLAIAETALLVAVACTAVAQTPAQAPSDADSDARVRSVVIGPQYRAGGLHRWLWGADYRDLYTMPVALPVLDLQSFAGGLRPTRELGHGQTQALG